MEYMFETTEGYICMNKKQFSNWLHSFYSTVESKSLTIEEAIKLQERENH